MSTLFIFCFAVGGFILDYYFGFSSPALFALYGFAWGTFIAGFKG